MPPTLKSSTIRQNEDTIQAYGASFFFDNADSIAFTSGYTPPDYIITNNNALWIVTPKVTEDTDVEIRLTATNSGGSLVATITLTILNVPPGPINATLKPPDNT